MMAMTTNSSISVKPFLCMTYPLLFGMLNK
jgi:hypothetical protein